MENYEQKYKEALSFLKDLKPHMSDYCIEKLEGFFPELTESEDEKIRKELLDYLDARRIVETLTDTKVKEEWIAWLEKQGEQKPIDMIEPKFKPGDKIVEKDIDECGSGTIKEIRDGKYIFEDNCFIYIKEQDLWQLVKEPVEPKFKVGDWVVDKHYLKTYQVSTINNSEHNYIVYSCKPLFNTDKDWPCFHEDTIRLWTIQDANDGDVLAEHETIVLFKKIEGQNIRCYCTYHYLGFNPTFYVGTLQNKNPYCPATKEQHDLLFQKMKDAGYEWDDEKKKLKKIEQNPTWSEEDEKFVVDTINFLYRAKNQYAQPVRLEECIDWIKSIKDRVQPQPKQEWSEEDELVLKQLIYVCHQNGWTTVEGWLESLKPNHWEPSEEQMRVLQIAIKDYGICHEKYVLESLYNNLKNL